MGDKTASASGSASKDTGFTGGMDFASMTTTSTMSGGFSSGTMVANNSPMSVQVFKGDKTAGVYTEYEFRLRFALFTRHGGPIFEVFADPPGSGVRDIDQAIVYAALVNTTLDMPAKILRSVPEGQAILALKLLRREYAGCTVLHGPMILQQFLNLKINGSDTTSYSYSVRDFLSKLLKLKMPMPDPIARAIMINNLPPTFEKIAIEQIHVNGSVDDLLASLSEYSHYLQYRQENPGASMAIAAAAPFGGRPGKPKYKNGNKPDGRPRNTKHCTICNKNGHDEPFGSASEFRV